MTARIFPPMVNPEFSATVRAIRAEQYRDDAFPFIRPAGQLWERVGDGQPDAQHSNTTRRTVLTGKQGPVFGDRASFTAVEVLDDEQGCTWSHRITNWPADERSDALRAAFAPFVEVDE